MPLKFNKLLGFIAGTFLLTACNPISPAIEFPEGKVVNCDQITLGTNSGLALDTDRELFLDCLDGQSTIDFNSISGPAVINFWGSWCAPCRDEIPYFVELNDSLPNGLKLIGVAREERSTADAIKFVRDFGITYPQLFDPSGKTKSVVGPSVPVTLFIDEAGNIAYQLIGPVDSVDELNQLISTHLGL
jgi:thiol-disulfide isomerase/thioredoxin